MAVQEPRPNHTIYINNLNEKIKKDGEGGLGGVCECHQGFRLSLVRPHCHRDVPMCVTMLSPLSPYCHSVPRAEEVPLRHFLAVWADFGHFGVSQSPHAGPGLCHLQGDEQRHQRPALHAGLPLLRQTHGETEIGGKF